MSKFFAQGNVSSDSDGSEEEEKVNNTRKRINNMRTNLRSESSDEEKREVRTQKDKRWAAIKTVVNKIKPKIKINDFNQIWNLFQELQKQIEKSKRIIEQGGHPNFYIRLLIQLIDFVYNFEDKKKLNVTNGKSYTILKQKLKKIEKDYQKQITAFKLNPVESSKQASEQSEDSFKGQQISEDSEQEDVSPLDSNDPMVRRNYWLKKKKPEKKESEEIIDEKSEKEEDNKQIKVIKQPKFNLIQNKSRVTNFTNQQSINKLKSISATFGRQVTYETRVEYIDSIQIIKKTLKSDSSKLAIILIEVPLRTDTARSLNQPSFKRVQWHKIGQELKNMLKIIQDSEEEELLSHVDTFHDQQAKKYYSQRYILQSMRSFYITLEEELRKAFIFTDFNDIEYSERLKDLIDFIEFSFNLFRFYDSRDGYEASASDIGFKLIQNTYYMNNQTFTKIKQQSQQQQKPVPQFLQLENPDRFQHIFSLVLKHSDDAKKTKVILYKVYNDAVQYRENAKDLLLVTDVLEKINSADYYTQAIFNRAIVQLGLNSFRNGNMYEVQAALSQLCSYGKTKELLAQGFAKTQQKDVYRKKILPYHLHVNVDMIESVQLIASMILEIPYTIIDGGRITSKTLKKVYEHYERSHFIAEPLNSRDLIYSASKELQKSNWKECFERLGQLAMWKRLREVELTKKNLLLRIKQQGLRCFLISNQQTFITISLNNLAQKFELPIAEVKTIANRMIYNNDLDGCITSEGFIKLTHSETNKMEKTIYELYEKVEQMITSNERDFDERLGNYVVTQEEENELLKEQKKKKNVILQKYKVFQNNKNKNNQNKRKN